VRPGTLLISVISSAPLVLAAQASAQPKCERIQLRFVDAVYRGTVPTHTPRIYRSSASGWFYSLSDTVVLGERGIASVGVQSVRLGSSTAWSVFARTTVAGAHALSEATATHVGRYLGIVIGDDLVDTPLIESQVGGSVLQLRGDAPRAVADSLATRASRAIDASCLVR